MLGLWRGLEMMMIIIRTSDDSFARSRMLCWGLAGLNCFLCCVSTSLSPHNQLLPPPWPSSSSSCVSVISYWISQSPSSIRLPACPSSIWMGLSARLMLPHLHHLSPSQIANSIRWRYSCTVFFSNSSHAIQFLGDLLATTTSDKSGKANSNHYLVFFSFGQISGFPQPNSCQINRCWLVRSANWPICCIIK